MALAKAVASSGAKLERLDLDDNQISEGGIDQIKVPAISPLQCSSQPAVYVL